MHRKIQWCWHSRARPVCGFRFRAPLRVVYGHIYETLYAGQKLQEVQAWIAMVQAAPT
ncbi:MAG: hypothetical protein U0528_07735 [Anaerolineae bacterium]